MEEEMILEQNVNVDNSIGVTESTDATALTSNIESVEVEIQSSHSAEATEIENTDGVIQEETIEYIDVKEQEPYVIEVEEAFASANNGETSNHALLTNRDTEDQHPIGAITGLQDKLHKLASREAIYAEYSGYAEFQRWRSDGHYKSNSDYDNTGGVGFFVSLVKEDGNTSGGNICVDICKKINSDNTVEVADVYGVTVANSGFCGNQAIDYSLLDPTTTNRTNDPDYAKVCLLGNVKVRVTNEEHSKINIGDYVVPNELGYAKKSENNVGFKVISKGQITSVGSATTAWYYVDIALVPQNDNVARVMAELEKAKANLENVNIQLGEMSGAMNDMYDINIGISDKFDNIQDVVNEGKIQVEEQLKISQEAAEKAQEIADEADATIKRVSLEYAEAVSKADEARDLVGDTLTTVNQIKKDLQPLAQWQEDGTNSIAGFVAQAEKNTASLTTMTQVFGDDASYLTAIVQKIDENGAAIQHLVSHVDKYILGEQSPANGLTLDETSIIQPGTIYVPIDDSKENYGDITVEFKFGKSYIWKSNDTGTYMWGEYNDIYTVADIREVNTADLNKDDLWYCWQGVLVGDKYLYNPGILYCWNDQIWTPVASKNDGTSSVVSLINQTAKKLTSTYTNLKGDMSLIEQEVDEIRTLVENSDSGTISTINQTAEEIMMGIYDADDGNSSSLGLLLDGMTSTSTQVNIVKVKEVLEAPPANIAKYEKAPMWNGTEFVMVGDPSTEGTYYFDPDESTYYCEAAGDKYYVYGVNNSAMANLSTRVTNTESEVETWTRFQKGQNETITSINQTSDEAGAAISSMVYGDFRECVEIKLELTDEDETDLSAERYAQQPKWNKTNEKFEFVDIEGGTEYCLSRSDINAYYKLLYRDSKIIGYEKYKMKSLPYSAIVQRVDNGISSVGLVSGNDNTIGSLFVNAINDKSEVLISADKIGINGTAVFTDNVGDGTTTISGNYIRSGVLQSNNYSGPVVNRHNGMKITEITGEVQDFYDTVTVQRSVEITMTDGTTHTYDSVVIGSNSNLMSGNYYCIHDGDIYNLIIHMILSIDNDVFYYIDQTIPETSFPHDAQFDLYQTFDSYDPPIYKLQKGESTDYIWYSSIQQGISYDLSPTGDGYQYYIGGKIEADVELTLLSDTSLSPSSYAGYIISANSFDLQQTDGSIKGTRFNLNDGTITSKNLVLDSGGNLSITGNITATSGFIGDGDNGFEIAKKTDGLYYLKNNQDSYMGDTSKGGGVYIAPDGIGLGNGKFYVDAAGNVVLKGSITWGASNSPTKVLYASILLTKPDDKYINGNVNASWKEYTEYAESSTSAWHRKYDTSDLYASYSYDGGITWTEVVTIKGVKGDKGSTGSQGPKGDPGTYTYITETVLNGLEIQSPTIYAGVFKTSSEGVSYAKMGNNEFAIYDVNDTSKPKASLGYNPDPYEEKTKSGGEIILSLGAGYTWDNGTVTDKFEIAKIKGGAEIRYTDDDATTTSIKFTDTGIVIDGLTGATAVFG